MDLSADLRVLEAEVQRALDTLDESGLAVLGYGEISLVLGWPREAPEYACKRLPIFEDRASLDRYGEVVGRYVAGLRAAGVKVVDSELYDVPRPDGRIAAYLVQPVLPKDRLGPAQLRAADPADGHPLVEAIFDHVVAIASPRLALDEQLANWAWIDGEAVQIDVTTPFMRDESGADELDFGLFTSALPWLMRWPVKRFVVRDAVSVFHEARSAIVDFLGNLNKEGLSAWLPYAIEEANKRVAPEITRKEVDKTYASDARLWATMVSLRKADRVWQRRVRRRQYPFLLPPKINRHAG
ncbi:MAG: DUF6206 family protein [Acidimicrobiia bacterium]|nr:DUF6206 family protein [Acidimicrobiia bacterium]